MEKGQALLEFEKAVEARKVFAVEKRLVGGFMLIWSCGVRVMGVWKKGK